MNIIEKREPAIPVKPTLEEITITLSAQEVGYIQRWAYPGDCYCFKALDFVWRGSSTLNNLILEIQKVKL